MTKDEYGITWVVMAHDPASRLLNQLKRVGFTKVVLPRYTYMTGQMPSELPKCSDYLDSVRMFDCATVLKNS